MLGVTVKVLRCTNPNDLPEAWNAEVGDEFRVESEGLRTYLIYVPAVNATASFTKKPDANGRSYKTWFELAEYNI